MWVTTLILGAIFIVLGIAGMATGVDDAWVNLIIGATWLKLSSLEKVTF